MRDARTGPEVSVVIPARDALQWLPSGVGSVGSDPRVEIVVVDDRSSDGTSAWLALLAESDSRVVAVQGRGRGLAEARNLGVWRAASPLVAFLDPDHAWMPGKLDRQLALHRERPDVGFSFTDYGQVSEAGEPRGEGFEFWPRFRDALPDGPLAVLEEMALPTIYAGNVVGCSTVIARADLVRSLGGFAAELPSAEDWDMWLRMAAAAPVGVIGAVLATRTLRPCANESGARGARLAAMRVIARRHRAAVEAVDPAAVEACATRLLVAEAEHAEADGRWLRATRLRTEAMLRAPCRRAIREAAASASRTLARTKPGARHQAPAAR